MKTRNHILRLGLDQQILAGIRKDLMTIPQFNLGAEAFTPTALLARIQARVDAMNVLTAAEAAVDEARRNYKEVDQQTQRIVADLQNVVMAAFGSTSPQLADFGFPVRKVYVPTDAQKVAAVARRRATRKARGTMGPKAKLAIKGAEEAIAPTMLSPGAPPAVS